MTTEQEYHEAITGFQMLLSVIGYGDDKKDLILSLMKARMELDATYSEIFRKEAGI